MMHSDNYICWRFPLSTTCDIFTFDLSACPHGTLSRCNFSVGNAWVYTPHWCSSFLNKHRQRKCREKKMKQKSIPSFLCGLANTSSSDIKSRLPANGCSLWDAAAAALQGVCFDEHGMSLLAQWFTQRLQKAGTSWRGLNMLRDSAGNKSIRNLNISIFSSILPILLWEGLWTWCN